MPTATATTPTFSDRVRFNWGYHDAASDSKRGKARKLTHEGAQNLQTVSRAYDAAYFYGYVEGLADLNEGNYRENSDPAWARFKRSYGAKFVDTQETQS